MATLTKTDPDEVLEALHAYTAEQIDDDCEEAVRTCLLWEQIDRLFPAHPADPGTAARAMHRRLCRAKAIDGHQGLPEAVRLYMAAGAADAFALLVVEAACETGRLAELGRTMEAIEAREGLATDAGECWEDGDGPPDYQAAADEHHALCEGVYDLAYRHICLRYDLEKVALLRERDRESYDALWERGRKELFQPAK